MLKYFPSKFFILLILPSLVAGLKWKHYVKATSGQYTCPNNSFDVIEKVEKKIKNGKTLLNYSVKDLDSLWCINACKDSKICNNIRILVTSSTTLECSFAASFPSLSSSPHPCIFYSRKVRRILNFAFLDDVEVFLDGELQSYNKFYLTGQGFSFMDLPADVKTIAILILQLGIPNAFSASTTDDYVLTSKSWKCTQSTSFDLRGAWSYPGYNSSEWQEAAEQNGLPVNAQNGVSAKAKWITLTGYSYVYCRFEFY